MSATDIGASVGEVRQPINIYIDSASFIEGIRQNVDNNADAVELARADIEAKHGEIITWHSNISVWQAEVSANKDSVASTTAGVSAAKAAAESASSQALTAQEAAETAQTAAETASTDAITARNEAVAAKNTALTSKDGAASSATAAENSATQAANAAVIADSAKTTAATSSVAASSAQVAAETAQTGAENAETNAVTAKTAARNAEDAAVVAANEAKTARDDAQGFALQAETHKNDAQTAVGQSSASATTAQGHATDASNSAGAATASASTASTQASVASGAATNAQNAETRAEAWAINPEDTEVETGQFSAMHHAQKALAHKNSAAALATSAEGFRDEAEGFKNTASASVSTAEGHATAASTSASNAEGSATAAATSAADAENHANDAANHAASASSTVAGITNGLFFKGQFDASSGNAPTTPADSTAHYYRVIAAGTVDSIDYGVGDNIVWDSINDLWFKVDNTERPITDSLNTDNSAIALSARAGKVLMDTKADNHTHPYRPDTWVPAWGDVTGKPLTFTPDSHNHPISDVTGLQAALDGKADSSHNHTWSSITGKPSSFTPSTHDHDDRYYTEAEVDSLLSGKEDSHLHPYRPDSWVPSWGEVTGKPSSFTPESHNHVISDVTGLQSALDAKADNSHNHDGRYYTESETDNLLAQRLPVNGKAADSHLLDGLASSEFARRDSFSAAVTVSGAEWVTIAFVEGGGRASARFKLAEDSTDNHGHVEFYTAVSHGNVPTINILSIGGYGSFTGLLRRLRVIKDGNDSQYGVHKVQVLLEDSCTLYSYLYEDEVPHDKWTLADMTEKGLPANYGEALSVDLDKNGGITTSGEFYAQGGSRVYHENNPPPFPPSVLPDQTGHTGKALKTDGTEASWQEVANKVHSHAISQVIGLQTALDGKADSHTHPYRADSWVPTWNDVTSKPTTFTPASHTHPISEITGLQTALDNKAASGHSHVIGDVTGLQTALDSKSDDHTHPYRPDNWVPAWGDVTGKPGTFTPAAHNHVMDDVTGLQSALDGKADSSHSHVIGDVTGLQAALDGKADSSHDHDSRYYTQAEVDSLIAGLTARINTLEAKTANQSVSSTTTVFSGEVQATELSIGN